MLNSLTIMPIDLQTESLCSRGRGSLMRCICTVQRYSYILVLESYIKYKTSAIQPSMARRFSFSEAVTKKLSMLILTAEFYIDHVYTCIATLLLSVSPHNSITWLHNFWCCGYRSWITKVGVIAREFYSTTYVNKLEHSKHLAYPIYIHKFIKNLCL